MAKSVYLAGPITGLTWEAANQWRVDVKNALSPLGIEVFSPLRAKNYLSHLDGGSKHVLQDSYGQFPMSTSRGIMTRDRWDAMRCDVLFVNFLGAEKVSIGTVMEIAWADAQRTPIVIAMEKDNIHQHSMINEATGYLVETIEMGIHIIKAMLMTE